MSEQFGFDSDGSPVIVDNSGNAHILSEQYMFTDKIDLIVSDVAETVGGKYLIPKGIVKVGWSWNYDEGQLHTNKLNNVI